MVDVLPNPRGGGGTPGQPPTSLPLDHIPRHCRSPPAETLADPYKGKTPLPRVPNYQEPFASRYPNTWKAKANQYLEHSPETHNHRIHSFPPIATE